MCAQIATLFNSVAFWGIADCLPVYLLDDALDYCIAVGQFRIARYVVQGVAEHAPW